jgi:hypothetical protein
MVKIARYPEVPLGPELRGAGYDILERSARSWNGLTDLVLDTF